MPASRARRVLEERVLVPITGLYVKARVWTRAATITTAVDAGFNVKRVPVASTHPVIVQMDMSGAVKRVSTFGPTRRIAARVINCVRWVVRVSMVSVLARLRRTCVGTPVSTC